MFRYLVATIALAAAVGLLGASPVQTRAAPLVVQIEMRGTNNVPPIETVVWGFVRFFFNDDRSEADYTVDVKGIPGGRVLGADIHSGLPGENGPVVFHLADGGFIVTSGHMTFSAQDLEEMMEGNWYVSLKTFDNPDGEIRGQVVLPANFLPGAPSVTNPLPGGITPPNTGDAGLSP